MRFSIRDYLRPGFVSWIPAIISVVGALSGGSGGGGGGGGGGGSSVPGASAYVPTWQGGADQTWQSILSQLTGTANAQAGMLTPYLNNAFSNTSDLYSQLAQRLGVYGGELGSAGSTMLDRGNGLYAAGGQLWHDALDPENALRDRTQQRVVDSSRAASSARGIGTSGESAGLENQAVSNFNLDWNDRQLGRESEGIRGLTSSYDSAGRQMLGGGSLLGSSAGMFAEAGKLPFDLSHMFSQGMAEGVYNPYHDIMNNLNSYLGLGQSASNQSYNQGQNNMANLGNGLNSIFTSPGWGTISQYFGGGGGGSTGSGASSTVDDTGWGGA